MIFLKRWVALSIPIGFLAAFTVMFIDVCISNLWSFLYDLYTVHPYIALILPGIAIGFVGLLMKTMTKTPHIQGTEEVLYAYNSIDGEIDTSSSFIKAVSAILTIGFGGSAGLEGPSIHAGASIATWLYKKLRLPSKQDRRIMVIAGAAAGISAIFKAPLTGVVFALEVPYKDDLAHEALVPSLISSVTSYLVFVSVEGLEPLFPFARGLPFSYMDLPLSILLGLIAAITATAFVKLLRGIHSLFKLSGLPLPYRALLGGLCVGGLGVLSIAILGKPFPLGPGYEVIRGALRSQIPITGLILILLFKMFTTSLTLSSGGLGGIFIPLIGMGSLLGGILGQSLGDLNVDILVAAGMASFLAAGYKTPLAAVTFVAETTGNPAYIIPGLMASVTSYAISGGVSVSDYQKLREEVEIKEIAGMKVADAMSRDVIMVPETASLQDFVEEYVLRYHHPSFPVRGKNGFIGVISIKDLRKVPRKDWEHTSVSEIVDRNFPRLTTENLLGEAMDLMYLHNTGRIPVVDPSNPNKLVGIIAKTDIIRMQELARTVKE